MKNRFILLLTALATIFSRESFSQYTFQNITMVSNWSDPNVAAEPFYGIKYNGIWGWDDGNGNEYALIGTSDGYYFVDVTNPAVPVVSDFVAGFRDSCIWREIKTYSHYAYLISDDGPTNTFQIADLQYLPDSVHVVYNSNTLFSRAHTLFVDGDLLYCAAVKGGQFTSQAAMAVFSLANPESPVLLRKLNDDFSLPSNPVHDMFVRNDTIYASAGFDGLFIFYFNRLTNTFTYINSLTSYPEQGYNHSSALTDDSRTLIFMDEVPDGKACKSMDVTDLQNLSVNTTFRSNTGATPHNPFIVGNICYVAYYQDGLYAYDVSDVNNPVQLGYFDTYYQNPAGTYFTPAYKGAWGAYPFLPSGKLLVSDMQSGLFVLDVSAVQSVKKVSREHGFTIYPNPMENGSLLHYQFVDMMVTGRIRLLDNTGRVVYISEITNSQKGKLEIPVLKPGMYSVEIVSKNQGKLIQKLVVSE